MDKATLRAEIDEMLDLLPENRLQEVKEFVKEKSNDSIKINIKKHFETIVSEDSELLRKLAQ